MSTLAEIEAAADSLPVEEKEELLRFLATQLAENRRPSTAPVQGKASEWLRTAKGSVLVAAGESADDARMAYYSAKYGLTR